MKYFLILLFVACHSEKPQRLWWQKQSDRIKIANDSNVYIKEQHVVPENRIADSLFQDARSYFYEADSFSYRPYNSKKEVLKYLNQPKFRYGKFPIYIKDSLTNKIEIFWFKDDCVTDSCLLKKN